MLGSSILLPAFLPDPLIFRKAGFFVGGIGFRVHLNPSALILKSNKTRSAIEILGTL